MNAKYPLNTKVNYETDQLFCMCTEQQKDEKLIK
jgi:hypothetical protein